MGRRQPQSAFFRESDDMVFKARMRQLAEEANKVIERDTCKNCGALVVGHAVDAGLVVEYGGYKFCSDGCVEDWVDKQDV